MSKDIRVSVSIEVPDGRHGDTEYTSNGTVEIEDGALLSYVLARPILEAIAATLRNIAENEDEASQLADLMVAMGQPVPEWVRERAQRPETAGKPGPQREHSGNAPTVDTLEAMFIVDEATGEDDGAAA